jgi:hypothetical protein
MSDEYLARLRTLVVGAGMALIGTSAIAFEKEEHQRLGDAAYAIALAFVTQAQKTDSAHRITIDADLASFLHERHRDAFPPGLPASGPRNLTYGQIVACVDQMGGGAEAALRHVVSAAPSSAPYARSEALSRGLRDICADPLVAIFAARTNAAHFGDEGMAAFRFTHDAALRTAWRGGDLYDALVTNAVADHFLTDHFASGHVAADRRTLTDASAVAVHDAANRAGSRYRVVVDPAVERLAGYLCPPSDAVEPPREPPAETPKAPALLLDALVSDKLQSVRYGASPPEWPTEKDPSVFRTRQHLRRSCEWLRNAKGDVVVFRGDNYLFRAGADDQRMFVLLTQAASIVEVLEVRTRPASGQPPDSMFEDFRWDQRCREACDVDRVRVSIHRQVTPAGSPTAMRGGYLAFDEPPGVLPDRASEDPPVFTRTPYERGARAIMFGFSGEFAARAGKSQFGRVVGVAELWVPVPGTDNFWGVVGAAISQEREGTYKFWGTGPEVRLAYGLTTFPGTTVSGFYRSIKYGAGDLAGHLRVEHVGVRVDHGLSDLFGMYVALYDAAGSYQRVVPGFNDWGLSFGLAMKIPGLRALRFLDSN